MNIMRINFNKEKFEKYQILLSPIILVRRVA